MFNLPPEKIAELNEFGESEAWANFYLCAPTRLVRKFRLEAKRFGSVWVTTIPKVRGTLFNRIIGLGVREVVTESMLDDCIAVLQNAGCKNFMAQICPLAKPLQLPGWLEQRGFVRAGNVAKVYRGNEPAPIMPTDLRVESIGKEHADAFADVVLSAHYWPAKLHTLVNGNVGKPGWYHYIAFDREQPVSAAAMFVTNEVGCLGFGSTVKSHRQRGGQSAMFARRIKDGLALGCKWFVSDTAEDRPESPIQSYQNAIRAGFKLAYLRPNYIHQSPASWGVRTLIRRLRAP